MTNSAFATKTALVGSALRVGAVVWALVLVGCSSQSLPPALLCDAGGCASPIVLGSVGPSGDDAAANACASSPSDSPCLACAKVSCCQDLTLCDDLPACKCEESCVNSSCVSACEQQSPSGVSTLTQLDTCLGSLCPSCTELGVGDSCAAAQAACQTGLTCNGQWCTKSCAVSSDCVGLGSSGSNFLGEQSACVGTATGGDMCFPGCGLSSGDCAPFAGTACFSTMSVDGVTVDVCQSLLDAGVD